MSHDDSWLGKRKKRKGKEKEREKRGTIARKEEEEAFLERLCGSRRMRAPPRDPYNISRYHRVPWDVPMASHAYAQEENEP